MRLGENCTHTVMPFKESCYDLSTLRFYKLFIAIYIVMGNSISIMISIMFVFRCGWTLWLCNVLHGCLIMHLLTTKNKPEKLYSFLFFLKNIYYIRIHKWITLRTFSSLSLNVNEWFMWYNSLKKVIRTFIVEWFELNECAE